MVFWLWGLYIGTHLVAVVLSFDIIGHDYIIYVGYRL